MSAYNSFNGTHAGSNHKLLNVLLKEELNFQGHVMSDWGGTWDTTEVRFPPPPRRCPS